MQLKLGNKKCFITLLYRSPSQDGEEFNNFKIKWDETISNITCASPHISTFIGDFNVRNSDWWVNEVDNIAGIEINEIANVYGLCQIINNPTHILPNSLSCIDLCFTSQPILSTKVVLFPFYFQDVIIKLFMLESTFKYNFHRFTNVPYGNTTRLMLN